jgi:hypothetical protein
MSSYQKNQFGSLIGFPTTFNKVSVSPIASIQQRAAEYAASAVGIAEKDAAIKALESFTSRMSDKGITTNNINPYSPTIKSVSNSMNRVLPTAESVIIADTLSTPTVIIPPDGRIGPIKPLPGGNGPTGPLPGSIFYTPEVKKPSLLIPALIGVAAIASTMLF